MTAFITVKPDYAYAEKLELLKGLYHFIENEAKNFGFVCSPGCNSCCTTYLWTTSLEARYLKEVLTPELEARLLALKEYPRPGSTPNTMAFLLMQGKNPPEDQMANLGPCPLLSSENLCLAYERRPLTCRVMFSKTKCELSGEAIMPPEFLGLSSLLFQLIEELDVGGVYGHLIDQIKFLRDLEAGAQEVPEWLLGNREAPDLAYSPEEEYLRKALSRLYRLKLPSGKTFKEHLDEIKEGFGQREALSFLDEIL
ncbi:YkgJ family cysteine cluster protein [Thermosulfurimonas dismutans]|uniref:YkgJ family cysteine cluster protein n=1 Tax=Thermosulfurimonas dismutans TaxID=999894 RepID=A0A179D2S0_9BACT|nr:YkgJ family cysteine cluster protein [Thermosulfurimonas dismutans]OAQ20273.1 hypothetical protein TDIS_1628 [Thermosulfurimonas dismutans]